MVQACIELLRSVQPPSRFRELFSDNLNLFGNIIDNQMEANLHGNYKQIENKKDTKIKDLIKQIQHLSKHLAAHHGGHDDQL